MMEPLDRWWIWFVDRFRTILASYMHPNEVTPPLPPMLQHHQSPTILTNYVECVSVDLAFTILEKRRRGGRTPSVWQSCKRAAELFRQALDLGDLHYFILQSVQCRYEKWKEWVRCFKLKFRNCLYQVLVHANLNPNNTLGQKESTILQKVVWAAGDDISSSILSMEHAQKKLLKAERFGNITPTIQKLLTYYFFAVVYTGGEKGYLDACDEEWLNGLNRDTIKGLRKKVEGRNDDDASESEDSTGGGMILDEEEDPEPL